MALRNRSSAILSKTIELAGSTTAVLLAAVLLLMWIAYGFTGGFTKHWFDVLHGVTGATAFLMVFVLRHAEGREARATLLKLDELVASHDGARDEVVGIENEDLEDQEQEEARSASAAGSPPG